jgi:hypothetical protein
VATGISSGNQAFPQVKIIVKVEEITEHHGDLAKASSQFIYQCDSELQNLKVVKHPTLNGPSIGKDFGFSILGILDA